MPITHSSTQISWPVGLTDKPVAAGGIEDSEEFNLDVTCFQARIEVKAVNNGVPAVGDYVDLYLVETLGDPDGAIADEFAVNGVFLGRLDTNADDPSIEVYPLPVPNKGCKLRAISNAASNSITASAVLLEQRG